jgi:hypothetical protein
MESVADTAWEWWDYGQSRSEGKDPVLNFFGL